MSAPDLTHPLAFLHQHTLNRHVPAMEQGFSILTRYGELVILDGPLADQIRDLVAQDAQLNLMQLAQVSLKDLTGEGAEL